MKYTVNYEYREEYIPPRCRKPRYRDVDGAINITIKEIASEQAPIAMITTTLEWREVDNVKLNNLDLIPVETIYRWHKNKLYTNLVDRYGKQMGISFENKVCGYPYNASQEERIKEIKDSAKKYLIIDGIAYTQSSEPRYVINTFGLGHNHGGTGFFIENYYNGNIGKKNYFNALERDKAIEYFNRVALGRGDDKSVDENPVKNIKVLIPESVRCKPKKEHDNGCEFINSLESMINGSSSVAESGFLTMAMGLSQLNN